ncbi:uncharacterized protein LOC131952561 [Physella acuta]|uniref:uncharacterized protein LOC131952561 n=1 Tax=Physella acuta TaxID=109671 RepID=UPI0027DB9823|nr:uncharacterized protein LOC131952561 [Physella acuta]
MTGTHDEFSWCTIMLIIILVVLLIILLVSGACAFTFYLRASDRRALPAYNELPDMDRMYRRPSASQQQPGWGAEAGYPPSPMTEPHGHLPPKVPATAYPPMLTPYQQYLIAQNWSNMYQNYMKQLQEQQNKHKEVVRE